MNFNNMENYQIFLAIGGGVFVLGLLAYFIGGSKATIPAAVTSGVGGLLGGLAIGVLIMAAFGYKPLKEKSNDEDYGENAPAQPGPKMGPGGGGGGMGGMGKGGGMMGGGGGMGKGGGMMGGGGGAPGGPKGGFGGGFGGPPKSNPKAQLASLVTSLGNVAEKPVTITLTDDEKQAIVKELKGVNELAELSEKDAEDKLAKLHDKLASHRKALESIGYRWPNTGGGAPQAPKDAANPFKEGSAADQLKALLDRLTAKK